MIILQTIFYNNLKNHYLENKKPNHNQTSLCVIITK